MQLVPGTRLGAYEIVGLLGAGGMGEVYRARDSRLRRDVAIKVVQTDCSSDQFRRFEQEARAAASLNHPNILNVFDIGEHDGTPYVVSELLEGRTLREALANGALPLRKAVDIAIQIAEGLGAAHDKGIVHRDLKPENLFVTDDGRVKILDFGLAKFMDVVPAGDLSALATAPEMTAPGIVLGTIGYMSPEQVNGNPADHRSDIFAFGAVLYELLSGRRAFQGASWVEAMSAILNNAPPQIATLGTHIPPALVRIVERCLEKAPPQRFQSAKDLSFALQAITESGSRVQELSPAKWSLRHVLALAFVALASAVGSIAFLSFQPAATNQPSRWTGILLNGPEFAFSPRMSPDGRMVAFQALINGQTEVAVMNPTSGDWTLLTRDTKGGIINQMSWSRDGTRIYFDRQENTPVGVFSISALGGEPRLILENAGAPEQLPDGDLLVTRKNDDRLMQLFRYRSATSQLEPLNAVVTEWGGETYRASPDGATVAFHGKPANAPDEPAQIYLLDLRSNEARRISETGRGFGFDARDGSLIVTIPKGDGFGIASIESDSDANSRVLLTVTDPPWSIDMAPDGSLYVGMVARPFQILRFSERGIPKAGLTVPGPEAATSVLELPDGRFLVTGRFDGHHRLLAVKPSGETARFVESTDETHEPAALIGAQEIAFLIGKVGQRDRSIAIASIRDGRIVKRLKADSLDWTGSLSASSDGSTLFYNGAGSIWSIPISGDGSAKKLGVGDGVAFDPRNHDLVVQLNEKTGVRFVRMSPSTGETSPIVVKEPLPIPWVGGPVLTSRAVRSDGRIAFTSGSPKPWFLTVGSLDPQTGDMRVIPSDYEGDVISPSWNNRGEITAVGLLLRAAIWRFRPDTGSADSPR